MKRVVFSIFICIYIVITILVTSILLSYNDRGVAESSKFYLVSDNSDLVIIDKNSSVNSGDSIYYYDNSKISSGIVTLVNDNGYKLDSGITIGKDDILGIGSSRYGIVGSVYSVLTSKWGYLFIIIFPMVMAFIYEIYEIVKEIKKK